MTRWTYFPSLPGSEGLQVRRRKIGFAKIDDEFIDAALHDLTGSNLSTDVLLTLAANELRWMANSQVRISDWSMAALSNGAAFLIPTLPKGMCSRSMGGASKDVLSAEAAGICATIFLLQTLHEREGDFPQDRRRTVRRLFDFVGIHPEAEAIRSVLD